MSATLADPGQAEPTRVPQTANLVEADPGHDVFISHADKDKEAVARPLAEALKHRGWTVWLDELELIVGNSLSDRIDQALSRSRFGVVVLRPAFFAKQWPRRELAGLTAREVESGTKVILPVWHQSGACRDCGVLAHTCGPFGVAD